MMNLLQLELLAQSQICENEEKKLLELSLFLLKNVMDVGSIYVSLQKATPFFLIYLKQWMKKKEEKNRRIL